MSEENIRSPKDLTAIDMTKVVAPSLGNPIDLLNNIRRRFPTGTAIEDFSHPIPKGLLFLCTRFGMDVIRTLARAMPSEAIAEEHKTLFPAVHQSGLGLVQFQPSGL